MNMKKAKIFNGYATETEVHVNKFLKENPKIKILWYTTAANGNGLYTSIVYEEAEELKI
jgi:hypothetical protein